MKTVCLILFALLFAAPCLFAQTLDPVLQAELAKSLPEKYMGYLTAFGLVVFVIGRFMTARKNGLSVFESIMAVVCGTNTPNAQILVVCLCMLSLTSCSGLTAFFASNAGKAVVSLADLGLNLAEASGKITAGQHIAVRNGVAIVTDPNDATINKVFKLEELGLKQAVADGLIKPGDSLIIQETTAIIKSAIVPVQPPNAKQPRTVEPVQTSSSRPAANYPPPCAEPGEESTPGCMKLAQRIPDYGYRVAFMLSNGPVR